CRTRPPPESRTGRGRCGWVGSWRRAVRFGSRALSQNRVRCREVAAPTGSPANEEGHPEVAFFEPVPAYFARRLAIASPRSPGDFTVVTPAASIAANLPSAVPEPPDAIAPAWPMRLPFGALAPAMKPTTGLVTYWAMNSDA